MYDWWMSLDITKIVKSPAFNIVVVFFIRNLASGMVALFIPIYLFNELGFSIKSIILLQFVWIISAALGSMISLSVINKKGVRWILSLANISLILFFIFLWFIDTHEIIPFLLYIPYGLTWSFSDMSYFVLVSGVSASKSVAKETNMFALWLKVARLFAPLLGGILLQFLGNIFLSILCIVLVLLTLFFVSRIPNIVPKMPVTLRSVGREWWLYTRRLGDAFCNMFVEFAGYIFVILFPFLLLSVASDNSIQGMLGSASMIFAMIFSSIVAKIYDKNPKQQKMILRTGIFAYAIGLVIRGHIVTPLIFYIATDLFFNATQQSFFVPFWSQKYSNARSSDAIRYKMSEEISYFIGRITSMTAVFFIAASISSVPDFIRASIDISAIVMMIFGIVYSIKYMVIKRRSMNPRRYQISLKKGLMKKYRKMVAERLPAG
jgi:MFS family permease